MKMSNTLLTLLATALVLAIATNATANEARKLCVFDPSGKSGDAFNAMKDYQIAATEWGVDFEMIPYTNEGSAAEDFEAGKCDAVLLTGLRIRQFVPFTGTFEAMGALYSYEVLEMLLGILAKPKAVKYVTNGAYQTAAVFPGGAVYLFVRDRSIKSANDLAGKKIATIDYDVAAQVMVRQVGASIVSADISTFASMFNNGVVDACYAPATAFAPLELEKGLKDGGGIVKHPLAQLTLQVLIRPENFPEGFGDQSRAWTFTRYDSMMKLIQTAEDSVPSEYWIEIDDTIRAEFDSMFQKVRIRLRDEEKVYDGDALKLMRRVRCKDDGSRAECTEKLE